MSDSNYCSEPVSYAAVEQDCTSGLVIEVFDDSDKVGADVVLLHGCPQRCMPNPVEGLLEVYEDMVEVFLIFLTEDSLSKRFRVHRIVLLACYKDGPSSGSVIAYCQ